MSCKIDPILITDSLNTAREKINDVYTGRTEIWSGSTGFQSIVSRGDDTNLASSDYSVVLGGKNNSITGLIGDGKNVIIGGENNTIENNCLNSAIIGGENNILSGTSNSVIVGGSNIVGTIDNMTYVPKLISSGERIRNTRYVNLVVYEPDEGKVSAIQRDDEILLVTDSTSNSGLITSSDISLDLRNMVYDENNQTTYGRTVELIILDNTGHVGGILLGDTGSDYQINLGAVNSSLNVCTGSNYQHVTVSYVGNFSGVRQYYVYGTGI